MTDAQKLEALITRAIEGGWDDVLLNLEVWSPHLRKLVTESYEQFDERPIDAFLFNHKFAKALFGEERMPWIASDLRQHPPVKWQFHLQQAVIADDPIDYMYGVVFGNE
jgi:hypothetical protein